jgi:hypothetical protein
MANGVQRDHRIAKSNIAAYVGAERAAYEAQSDAAWATTNLMRVLEEMDGLLARGADTNLAKSTRDIANNRAWALKPKLSQLMKALEAATDRHRVASERFQREAADLNADKIAKGKLRLFVPDLAQNKEAQERAETLAEEAERLVVERTGIPIPE